MSNAQPTQGPWELLTAEGRLPIVRKIAMVNGEAATYRSVIRGAGNKQVCNLDFGYGQKSDEANALIIAASCELLTALKSALPFIDDADDVQKLFPDSATSIECRVAVALAHAAISKAEGR